jgi:hypothetical protein
MTEFLAVLLCAAALFALLGVLHARKSSRLEAARAKLKETLRGSGIDSRIFYGADASSALGVDEKARRIALAESGEEVARVYAFAGILSAEIAEDGQTVIKTSSTRSIGGAVAGGLLAGPAGFVVGGLGGGSTGRQLRDVRAIDVVVMLADMERPRFSLRVLDAPHGQRAETEEYRAARLDAEKLLGMLRAAIELADRESPAGQSRQEPANPAQRPALVADELAKLAALKEKGILTEEEFLAQKQGLLGSPSTR